MAAPLASETLEFGAGGLPLVQSQGLNTNQAVNFSSGFQVDTSGNVTMGQTAAVATLNITTAAASTGGTGTTAALTGFVGAAAGGPAGGTQSGWVKIKVAGTQVYIPSWT